jgi:hypothetical protein
VAREEVRLMPQPDFPLWVEWSNKLGLGAGTILASVGIGFGYAQYLLGRRFQRRQSAFQIYSRYLDLAFQNPKFAEPDEYGAQTEREKIGQYEWFVSILLTACEEMIEALGTPMDTYWHDTIVGQLGYHVKYLTTDPWFLNEGRKHYGPELLALVDEAIAEAGWKPDA